MMLGFARSLGTREVTPGLAAEVIPCGWDYGPIRECTFGLGKYRLN